MSRTVVFNRLSYLFHAGPRAAWQARERAWPTVYRFIAAKRILKHVYGFAPAEAVSTLETRLRFLEREKVIQFLQGNVYASRESGENIDLCRTLARAAWNAFPGEKFPSLQIATEENVAQVLSSGKGKLFFENAQPEKPPETLPPGWWERVRTTVAHPILKSYAIDFASGETYENRHREFAEAARATMATAPESVADAQACAWRDLQSAIRDAQERSTRYLYSFFGRSATRSHIRQQADRGLYPRGELKLAPQLPGGHRRWVFVVSDVHLTGESHTKSEQFLRFLYMACQLRACVVLAGDIYDFKVPRSGLERIMSANPTIWNAFATAHQVIYVPGNHDDYMQRVAKSGALLHANMYAISSGIFYDEGIFIEHGHTIDPLTREGTRLWVWGVKLSFWISKVFANFERWAELLARAVMTGGAWQRMMVDRIVKRVRAVYLMKERQARHAGLMGFSREHPMIYIQGHIHFYGDAFLYDAIRQKVEQDITIGGGRVELYFSSAWKDRETFAGNVLAIDMTPDAHGLPARTVFPLTWEYSYEGAVVRKDDPPRPPTPPPPVGGVVSVKI